MRYLKRTLVTALLASAATVMWATPSSAHVHGFTPLGCLTTDNPNSGAVIGFDRSSDQAAPHHGLSLIIPVNASGSLPSGGQGAVNACG
jgi:hypothetical protein